MKTKKTKTGIKVTLTESEAYRLFNFMDFATREGMDWITTSVEFGPRTLNRSDLMFGAQGEWGSMMGHNECAELAKQLFKVNDYMEVDL